MVNREPRWPATLAAMAALGLYVALPGDLVFGPHWVFPALEGALILPLVVAGSVRPTRESARLRLVSLGLIGLISLANAVSLGLLVHEIIDHGQKLSGQTLIFSAIEIWLTNVMVFSLWYWELDRGGPAARAGGTERGPDFLFVQMATPSQAPAQWRPGFVDYLYLSFTNCTAFSPTDTMPLSPWAKLLMLVQASISLVTVAVVAGRAVNIIS